MMSEAHYFRSVENRAIQGARSEDDGSQGPKGRHSVATPVRAWLSCRSPERRRCDISVPSPTNTARHSLSCVFPITLETLPGTSVFDGAAPGFLRNLWPSSLPIYSRWTLHTLLAKRTLDYFGMSGVSIATSLILRCWRSLRVIRSTAKRRRDVCGHKPLLPKAGDRSCFLWSHLCRQKEALATLVWSMVRDEQYSTWSELTSLGTFLTWDDSPSGEKG